jgi:general secretion pathway protein C
MQALPFGQSSFAQTAVVSLLTLVAVALLGLVLAYWTWVWFAPRAEPRVEAVAEQSGSIASASALFGIVQRNQNTAAPTGIAIRLLGVAAASPGRRGYAVVQLDAKQILVVHDGEDVSPGMRLAEVHPDHVSLERGGLRETLTWPEKKTLASAASRAAEAAALRAAAEAAALRSASEVAAPQVTAPQVATPQAAEAAAPQTAGAAAPTPRAARAARRADSD